MQEFEHIKVLLVEDVEGATAALESASNPPSPRSPFSSPLPEPGTTIQSAFICLAATVP